MKESIRLFIGFLIIFVVLMAMLIIYAPDVFSEPRLTADPYPVDSGISAFGVVVDGGVTEFVPYSEEGGRAVVYRGGILEDDGKHIFEVWAISKQAGRDSLPVPFLLYEKLKPLSNTGYKP
ncbi:hypothetical protein LCGC14_2654610 [marine sediment metagenome]|uniref:Uncharacterized protein n=1 Tax=marine sediment metagenome TaxID=412755 RepID=A0A0F9CKT2_9ZZZZ